MKWHNIRIDDPPESKLLLISFTMLGRNEVMLASYEKVDKKRFWNTNVREKNFNFWAEIEKPPLELLNPIDNRFEILDL